MAESRPPVELKYEAAIVFERRVIDLEVRYAHLERLVDDLNGVIVAQQKEIARLQDDLRRVAQRAFSPEEPVSNDPPPHY